MQLRTWRKVFSLTNSLAPALSQLNAKANLVAFHSTPVTCEKWKNKWKSEVKRTQQPSKTYIKYETRQKRADTKRALRDLLFNSGAPKSSFQVQMIIDDDLFKLHSEVNHKARILKSCCTVNTHLHGFLVEDQIWRFGDGIENQDSDGCDKKQKSKVSSRRGGKFHNKKQRNHRGERFSDEFDLPENIFQATFGNRWYTWSFRGDTSQNSTFGFEWREHVEEEYRRSKKWETLSDAESEDEELTVGSHSDRTILGLPPTGHLKMEDVKNAFRLSALKWHPDKHQGPSQAAAEEKFKLCVNAYKSLCAALT